MVAVYQQELAEGCRRLSKNAIICWTYLYLSQKIGQEPDADRRQAILVAVQQGSVVSWRHVNLHGEYDFSDEKMQDSVGLYPLPALALSPPYAGRQGGWCTALSPYETLRTFVGFTRT